VKLGQTSLEVSRVGLGLAALGRPGYITIGHSQDVDGHTDVDAMRANAHAVLDAAYAAGVRYFDAARSYGRAEEFLGSWLAERELSPPTVGVGSKWGYTYTAGWRTDAEVNEVKDLSIDTLRRQEQETRQQLGSNLGLYQIHSATLESGVLDDPLVLQELARLRADGLLIGLTVTGPRQADTVARALEVGGFDAVQATWNLLEPSAGPALAAAHAAGLGVIVKEAVANGRLTARGDVPQLTDAARQVGVTPDALALAAVLAQPWVDVVLSGASTVRMTACNVAAVDVAIDPETLAGLGGVAEDPDGYWERRSTLRWN
ncbi:MAG TPA: aldo/keto reductase, partial [Solirubrobacteraceae bacterium]|nr:aldo/keto reductase [Solirubrobacteraceae bacterium]